MMYDCGIRSLEWISFLNGTALKTLPNLNLPFGPPDFLVDLRERLHAVWRELDGADPRTHAQKLATYHAWMALPLKPSNVRGPSHLLPRYLWSWNLLIMCFGALLILVCVPIP